MLYSIIMTIMITKSSSLVLQDPYNILLKDDTDYKIEESILEEEYELYDQVTSPGSARAKDTPERNTKANNSINTHTSSNKGNMYATTNIVMPKKYWHYRKVTPKKYIFINNETDYNLIAYDDFPKEAGVSGKENMLNLATTNNTDLLQTIKSMLTFETHCKNYTEGELKNVGFSAIYCLLLEYRRGDALGVVAARLLRIVKIWTLVYLCVALPLWCMKGWCCCCLCCKFFRPRQTIEEAKKYFLRNPPGVLKVNRGEIQYDPSENERDAYEEFEHLLRTI